MSRYLLTRAADEDMDSIWRYVADQTGPRAADRLEDRLHRTMERLAEAPGIGHERTDLAGESLRIHPLFRFLIIYRCVAEHIEIVRVLHGGRDVGAILASRSR
jgi:toxin ParE1/3/4